MCDTGHEISLTALWCGQQLQQSRCCRQAWPGEGRHQHLQVRNGSRQRVDTRAQSGQFNCVKPDNILLMNDDASGEPIMFCTFTSDQVIYRTDLIICCTSHIREKIIAIFISISCLTWPVVTTHFAYSLSSGNLIEIFLSNSLRFVLCPEVLLSLFPSGTY